MNEKVCNYNLDEEEENYYDDEFINDDEQVCNFSDGDYDDDYEADYDDESEDEIQGIDEQLVLEKSSLESILETLENADETEFREFCNSDECEILIEAGKFTKNTILSLNRNDELKKRTNKIAINIEAQKNSALWKKYVKYRKAFMSVKKEIIDKNYSKATKLANKQLKMFAKNINTKRIPTTARILDNKKK